MRPEVRQEPRSRGANRRAGWLCLAAAAAVASLLSPAPAGSEKPPTTNPVPPKPEAVLAELRAANAARGQLLQAEQDWALEKEKLELLKSTVLREGDRLKSVAAAAKAAQAKLAKEISGAQATQKRLTEVEAMVDALAERLEKALSALSSRCLPGVVPPDTAAGITEPSQRLSAAAERLGQAQGQARKSGVEIVDGLLDGKSVTVKLLRAGGVAAWWMSLDGERSGQARLDGGKLSLEPARTPRDAEAIRAAFSVAQGHAAPGWSLLPVHHVPVKPKAGPQP